jgi:perosamine synthetase
MSERLEGSIPVAGPWITEKEVSYVTDAASGDWYANSNNYVGRFEKAFASYIGSRFAISLPSCTSALHLSLMALEVGPSDEVIVPDVTWIASVAPVSYVGAIPVFADIDQESWCISAESLECCITEKTKAIIVVDLYGNMPDWSAIQSISEKYNIPLIEDAAEAIGSLYKGSFAGSIGKVGTFSFHGSKTVTTGEGGMLVTDDQSVYERCMFLRDHGRAPGDVSFCNEEIAYKYKMSSMQAAMGLAQIERAEELVGKKRQIFQQYREGFSDMEGIHLNAEPDFVRNSFWMSTMAWDDSYKIEKTELMARLLEEKIHVRPFFSPLTSIPAYKDLVNIKSYAERNINSYRISFSGINLPSALSLGNDEIDMVIASIKNIFSQI